MPSVHSRQHLIPLITCTKILSRLNAKATCGVVTRFKHDKRLRRSNASRGIVKRWLVHLLNPTAGARFHANGVAIIHDSTEESMCQQHSALNATREGMALRRVRTQTSEGYTSWIGYGWEWVITLICGYY
jgi:hypothetical protein